MSVERRYNIQTSFLQLQKAPLNKIVSHHKLMIFKRNV